MTKKPSVLEELIQFCRNEYDQAQRDYVDDPSYVHSVRTDAFQDVINKAEELQCEIPPVKQSLFKSFYSSLHLRVKSIRNRFL